MFCQLLCLSDAMCCKSWVRSDAWKLVLLFERLHQLEKTGMIENMKIGGRARRINSGEGGSTRVI